MVLDLINDMKFHEEFMSKWKIFDLRIQRTIKSLETIYVKLYFNQQSPKLIALFANLQKETYYYFLEDKRMSYLIADALNMIKAQLTSIKNIRKDSAFKLSILTYCRKALYLFFLNLEFLAGDPNNKLVPTKAFKFAIPFLMNSFNELEVKFDNLMRFLTETYSLNNKYLHHFFNKEYFRAWFVRIRDKMTETYKFLLTRDIFDFFQKLQRIDDFIVTDFFDTYIKNQIEVSSQFATNLSAVPEQCLLESLFNDLFDYISRTYHSWADFEFEKIKSKLSEVQGKILTLKLTDSMLKTKLVKITKSFEEFFTSDENVQVNAFNISFAFSFRKEYQKVISIIKLKEFRDRTKQRALLKFIVHSTKDFMKFAEEREELNRIYFKMRILKNLSKFITKVQENYHRLYGKPRQEGEEEPEGDAGPAGDGEGGEAPEEEMKKPPELEEVYLPCRYFPYKKKTRQNFAYIKNKWGKQDQETPVRRAVHLLQGRPPHHLRQDRPQPAHQESAPVQNRVPRKVRGPVPHPVLQVQHDVHFGVPDRGRGRPVHPPTDPPHPVPHHPPLRPQGVNSTGSTWPTCSRPRRVSGGSTSTRTS